MPTTDDRRDKRCEFDHNGQCLTHGNWSGGPVRVPDMCSERFTHVYATLEGYWARVDAAALAVVAVASVPSARLDDPGAAEVRQSYARSVYEVAQALVDEGDRRREAWMRSRPT